jgi:hypothetical protein
VCHQTCETCYDYNYDHCESCYEGNYLYENTCFDPCPAGTY